MINGYQILDFGTIKIDENGLYSKSINGEFSGKPIIVKAELYEEDDGGFYHTLILQVDAHKMIEGVYEFYEFKSTDTANSLSYDVENRSFVLSNRQE